MPSFSACAKSILQNFLFPRFASLYINVQHMAPSRKQQVKSQSTSKNLTKSAVKKTTKSTMATSSKSSTSKAEDPNDPIYFWREYGTEHCFLSQWYESEFTTDANHDIVYKNAEQ